MIYSDYDENGFKVFQTYSAMKNHFTVDKYDYFKYNGKVSVKFNSFKARRDRHMFNKMASYNDYRDIILANLVNDPKKWIGDIADKEGLSIYREWRKTQDNLTRVFTDDLKKMNEDNFKSNFKVIGGNQPMLVKLALRKQIHLETFAILMDITKVSKYWKENIDDPILTPKLITKAEKYHGFLDYNQEKMLEAIDNVFL